MQMIHNLQPDPARSVDFDLRILLISADPAPLLTYQIARLGVRVDRQHKVNTALAAIIDDPRACGLLIMDCDGFGGGDSGEQAAKTSTAAKVRVPVILISKEYQSQIFPHDRDAPICLRAPLSPLSLRVGVEHALRHQLI